MSLTDAKIAWPLLIFALVFVGASGVICVIYATKSEKQPESKGGAIAFGILTGISFLVLLVPLFLISFMIFTSATSNHNKFQAIINTVAIIFLILTISFLLLFIGFVVNNGKPDKPSDNTDDGKKYEPSGTYGLTDPDSSNLPNLGNLVIESTPTPGIIGNTGFTGTIDSLRFEGGDIFDFKLSGTYNVDIVADPDEYEGTIIIDDFDGYPFKSTTIKYRIPKDEKDDNGNENKTTMTWELPDEEFDRI